MSIITEVKAAFSNFWQAVTTFPYSSLFSFGQWAQWSTPKTLYYGVIPPLSSILTLTLVAGLIASGAWAWSAFLTTAQTGFMPILGNVIPAVLGATLLNYLFHREITTVTLSSREVRKNFIFSEDHTPTDVRRIVKQVTAEVNAYYLAQYLKTLPTVLSPEIIEQKKQAFIEKHAIRPPRVSTFTSVDNKIVTVEGSDPDNAGIFISSGLLDFAKTGLNRHQFAALMQKEVMKIYNRRGVGRTIVGMVSDLSSTISNLSDGHWLFRAFFVAALPLQLVLILDKAIQRSFEYQAAEALIPLGRAVDYFDAIDQLVCPTLGKKGTHSELQEDFKKPKRQRAPYTGNSKLYGAFYDWVRKNEYAGDSKAISVWRSALNIITREGGYYLKELFSDGPRTTSMKAWLRPKIAGKIENQTVDLNKITSAQKDEMIKIHREINREWFKKVVIKKPYEEIGPDAGETHTPVMRQINDLGAGMVQVANQSELLRGLTQGLEKLQDEVKRLREFRDKERRRKNEMKEFLKGHLHLEKLKPQVDTQEHLLFQYLATLEEEIRNLRTESGQISRVDSPIFHGQTIQNRTYGSSNSLSHLK